MSMFSTLRPIAGASQNVTIGAASAQSTAFGAGVFDVRVVATVACYVRVDTNPTAVTTDTYLPAGVPEYFRVSPGQKMAVIQASAGGTLNITEMTR